MKLLVITVAAALLAMASVSSATAKGTLTVDPSPVAQGSTFTLAGCGYPAPTSISFHVVGPDTNYFTTAEPLAESCFSERWTAWWGSTGAYSITSYYRDSKGALRKVAVVKFDVE